MRKYFFIALILMLAIFLRFFSISTNPPSLTWDEAAWGYNAYSLGTDGRDEFGKFLPLTYIESFGDYKPPLYAYLAVIPVRIFGLNEFATRFPSAFFGVLTVLITYFLTKRIFNVSSKLEIGNWKLEILPLLAAGLLAISPWHILLSRAAFEANVATFFIVLGVFLFFSSLSNKWLLPLSVISFIISMYTFNTARILAPLLLLVLLISQRKYLLFALKKQLFVSLILGAVFFLPLFLFLLTPQAKLRFQEVNIFTDSQVVDRANQQIANDNNAFWSKIIHNRRLGFAASFLNHYFDNFSPEFLFIKGDGNPKFSIRDVGQMYIWEIPFFIAGILLLFRKREGYWWIIPIWLILGIIPAATARETPHALRIEAVLPTFQILTAYGLYHLISNFKLRPILSGLVSIVAIFNFLYFYHNYFVHYPREFSSEWQYGYKEAIGFVKNNEAKYDKVILTEDLGRPYIYALFYTKYDPSGFRKEARIEREVYGFVHVREFGKYKFSESVKNNIDRSKEILYLDTPGKIPSDANILKKFKLLDGNEILVAYE
ncbi:MAG: hypothetical protein A3G66_02115 [Candidatus Levybacteria bacterium RIFCSPLOWO2_12_FULL_39_17]|nr:MAG: hypothetical protein A3G66_02115 [Candidatus Levybacteria bacterium RIFCSPLOWO2_12_FULL_39_17]